MIKDLVWFVVGFTPGPGGRMRAEVIMRLSAGDHAGRLAADLADDGGAIVLSQDYASWDGASTGLRIEAKYGNVPDDPQDWGLGELLLETPGVRRLPESEAPQPVPEHAASCATTERLERSAGLASRFARNAALVSLVVAALATSAIAIRANAAQRNTRLAEMARPHCSHSPVSYRNLDRIVRHASALTESKHDALQLIVTVCRGAVVDAAH